MVLVVRVQRPSILVAARLRDYLQLHARLRPLGAVCGNSNAGLLERSVIQHEAGREDTRDDDAVNHGPVEAHRTERSVGASRVAAAAAHLEPGNVYRRRGRQYGEQASGSGEIGELPRVEAGSDGRRLPVVRSRVTDDGHALMDRVELELGVHRRGERDADVHALAPDTRETLTREDDGVVTWRQRGKSIAAIDTSRRGGEAHEGMARDGDRDVRQNGAGNVGGSSADRSGRGERLPRACGCVEQDPREAQTRERRRQGHVRFPLDERCAPVVNPKQEGSIVRHRASRPLRRTDGVRHESGCAHGNVQRGSRPVRLAPAQNFTGSGRAPVRGARSLPRD